ncbi:ABC transporter substrate-binding protein [Pseudomonas entomophila]|uniref:ABC transporter substrate-binding protein n=1 Tax=Pseudomonas entomophila TaxID=312306 RepID=UPI0015E4907E|nr:ABC transporter substrate-binding protein [Pseudomonas entomophila]MBA1189581.1 ABC transporter substrate-binding protein [Pseudomonas entomophila]
MSVKGLISALGLSLVMGAASLSVQAAESVKVALGTEGFVHMPLFVALDSGMFKKHGLDVELVKFKGGGAAASGLASRSVEFCSCAIQNAINAKVKGADITLLGRLVGQYASNVVIHQDLAARLGLNTDSTVEQRLAAFKRLRLAVSGAGGSADFLVRFLGKQAKLDPEKDFTLLYLNNGAAMLAAFAQNRIDGFALSSPASDSAVLDHKGYTLLDMSEGMVPELDGYPSIALSARRQWATEHQDTVKAFLAALSDATTLINEQPKEAMKSVRSRFEGVNDTVYAAAWENNRKSFPQTPYLTDEDVNRAIKFLGDIQNEKIPGEAKDYLTQVR